MNTYNVLTKESISFYRIERLDPFLNLTVSEISEILGVRSDCTSITRELSKRFLDNSNFRSIRRSATGTIKESIPLDNINFISILEEEFNDSNLKTRFDQGFHFLIYDHIDGIIILKYSFFWSPTDKFIQENVYKFWLEVKSVVSEGVKIERVKSGNKYINRNNLPKASNNPILHVRPKAQDSSDTTPLPKGGEITKQAYWINNTYLRRLILDFEQIAQNEDDFVSKSATREVVTDKNLKTASLSYYRKRLMEYSELRNIYEIEEYKTQIDLYAYNQEIKNILQREYQLRYGYYINKGFSNVSEAIIYDIKNLDYLDLNTHIYRNFSAFQNIILNLNSTLEIIEIEEGLFITRKNLTKGGITSKDIQEYIKEIIDYAGNKEAYFNIALLKSNRIGLNFFRLGFDDIFYEDMLKKNPNIEHQTYKGNIIFTINTVKSSVITDLVSSHIIGSKEIYRYEILDMFRNNFKIDNFTQTDILYFQDFKRGIYYCQKMDMFFVNEERYLDTILRRI